MGGRPIRTLSDAARHDIEIVVTRGRCGHVRVLDPWTLEQLFKRRGWSRYVDDIGRRLRCSRCKPSLTLRLRMRQNVTPPRQAEEA